MMQIDYKRAPSKPLYQAIATLCIIGLIIYVLAM